MERSELKKFVYIDNNITKVLRGYVIKEDDFLFTIEAQGTKAIIVIGKRSIVKIDNITEQVVV